MDTIIIDTDRKHMTVTANPFTGPHRANLYSLQKRFMEAGDKETRHALFDAAVQLLFGNLTPRYRRLVLPFIIHSRLRRTVQSKFTEDSFNTDDIMEFIGENFEACEEIRKFFDLDVTEGWENRLFPNPEWRQANPFDQLTILIMSLEGHVDNVIKGHTNVDRLKEVAPGLFEQLRELIPHLQAGRWA